jgi:molybdopterin-synthase adenylyltransferase
MSEERFDRNERLFGAEGQERIGAARLAIVGSGGLGSIFGEQAAYMGFRSFAVIDGDIVTGSSMNRLVGAIPSDVGRCSKVAVARRTIRRVDPTAVVDTSRHWLGHPASKALLATATTVIACLDDDYARLQLVGLVTELGVPCIDLASDVSEDGEAYGGRVVYAMPGRRCVYCVGELDPEELARGGMDEAQRAARDRIYGVRVAALGARGASVVSLNGVVASLGLTELMVAVTGLREPAVVLRYRGDLARITRVRADPTGPCPYCGRD